MAPARVLLATGLAVASLSVNAFVSPRGTLVGRRAGCRAATSRTFHQRMRMADEDIVDAAEKATDGVAAAIKDGADSVGKAAVEGAKDVALAAKDRVSLGGVEVSPLGVGAWSWGDTVFWGYSEAMDKELQEVFGNCVGGGVNLFDTAEVYGIGRSEYLCGKFRRDYKGADKDGIVIASKFAPLPWRLGRSSVVDACKASLDRMGAESMEIYQIHWPFGALNSRYWDGLADCVDQGLVKAVGVSNYGPEAVKDAHAALKARGVKLGSNQIQFSLANRQAYKTFERALKVSLEDPRFGIGKTREEFEDPFKGSIGSGSNRTAMYGSVFEAAVDLMFRNSKLTANHKFLDIGCGIGSIVLQAAAWAGCQAAGIEIVEDRFAGAVELHSAFQKAVFAERDLGALLHPDVVEQKVHLFKGCFLEQWENPEVRDADFIFFNNSSGWFNNSKALNNPDEHSLESRLLKKLKNDPRNNGKVLVTLEHIAEWQPTCWERRSYKYSDNTRRAATYAAKELEFWEYTVVSQWECPGCTSMNSDAVNDCVVCGTYCSGKRNSKRL